VHWITFQNYRQATVTSSYRLRGSRDRRFTVNALFHGRTEKPRVPMNWFRIINQD
jgi:hypothetical protein